MANLNGSMGRLAKIEKDVHGLKEDVHDLKGVAVRMTEILTDHSQQLTDLRRTTHAMVEQMGGVNDRLDRLIALSMQERTAGIERLGDIERRLARLEERSGI